MAFTNHDSQSTAAYSMHHHHAFYKLCIDLCVGSVFYEECSEMWYTLWIVRFRESMGISTHTVLSECIRTFVCLSGNNICMLHGSCRNWARQYSVGFVMTYNWHAQFITCVWTSVLQDLHVTYVAVCYIETLGTPLMLHIHDRNYGIHNHEIMLAHPPNLSILISGGKCTTLNAFSHREWTRIISLLETMTCALNCCICMYYHFGYGCKLLATSSNWGWQPSMRPVHMNLRCTLFE